MTLVELSQLEVPPITKASEVAKLENPITGDVTFTVFIYSYQTTDRITTNGDMNKY